MGKIITILILGIVLSGCTSSNGEIIRETKKCEDAGLRAFQNDFGKVTCVISDTSRHRETIDACKENGGVPILSLWDNRLKTCEYPPK